MALVLWFVWLYDLYPLCCCDDAVASELFAAEAPKQDPIFEYCQSGQIDKVSELISTSQYSVFAADENGHTPLHYACLNNHLAVVKLLMKYGSIVDAQGLKDGQTPLMWSCIRGHLAVVHYLVTSTNADITVRDKLGYSAITHAVQYGNTLIVHYLKCQGASLDERDYDKHSLLSWSCYNGHIDTTRYLLRHGLLNERDAMMCTPLHWAVMMNRLSIVRILLHAGADLDLADTHGSTAEALSVSKKLTAMTELFVSERYRRALPSHTGIVYSVINALTKTPSQLALIITAMALYLLAAQNLPFYVTILLVLIIAPFSSQFYNLLTPLDITARSQLYVLVSWCTILFSMMMFYVFMMPYMFGTYQMLCMSMMASTSALCYCKYKAWKSDPGYLVIESTIKDLVPHMNDSTLDSDFCGTCAILKPARSKHCSICDACVCRMDHHCPWIDNCVGGKNHVYFIGFLFFVNLSFTLYYVVVYLYLTTSIGADNPHVDGESTTTTTTVYDNISRHAWMVAWCIYIAILNIWIGLLLISQAFNIAYNMTTNESANWNKYEYLTKTRAKSQITLESNDDDVYHNVFDRGIVRNCSDFFVHDSMQYGYRSDWRLTKTDENV